MVLRPNRLVRLLDATSQWLNVLLLNGNANESISGRAYRCGWRTAERVIDTLAFWEDDHCRLAYLTDIARADKLLKENRLQRRTDDGMATY